MYSNPLESPLASLYKDGEKLTNIVIPEGTLRLERYVFYNLTDIEELTLPSSLEYISYGVFSPGFSRVNVPSIKDWCEIEFYNASSNPLYYNDSKLYVNGDLVDELVIGNDVTSIGKYSFYEYPY